MKKIYFILIILAVLPMVPLPVCANMSAVITYAPPVEYSAPANAAVVDLTGKSSIMFEWRRVPIPSGGRECYKFVLYKDPGYEVVEKRVLDARTFSIEIPADKFENGSTYRWKVLQRDAMTMIWSKYDLWYFKAVKK